MSWAQKVILLFLLPQLLLRQNNMLKKNLKGFTFVGTIVAVAIVAVLAVVVIAAVRSNQSKARDSLRVSEINALRDALQLFYMEHGYYPLQEDEWCSIEQPSFPPGLNEPIYCPEFRIAIEPYVGEIPGDPLNRSSAGIILTIGLKSGPIAGHGLLPQKAGLEVKYRELGRL